MPKRHFVGVYGASAMKGNREVINQLNQVLYHHLTAINQYFLHSRMFNDWGIEQLGSAEYKESIRQMKHADKIIERVLFLEGLPNLQHLGKLYIGQHTEEVLNCDIRKVKENIATLKQAVELSEAEQDYVTRDLVQEILEKEEEYWDWLDTQLDLIENVGIENYIQSQI
ncbi:bacterioferritin [Acinetobacter haemolyticus ATCC 19194]|uniref:Bacterioferritin n=4 Tax=Acinetobacter TaxID=469 RepID=D4XU72_ACIHA|nr:bacterioferritin [Acinetobacter haemolyticus ATCC 19194]